MRSHFFDAFRHVEALSQAAADCLARGDFSGGFRFADRRCRIAPPRAADRLLRARALRGLGADADALDDLAAAARLDPTDAAVNAALLQWGPPDARAQAARRLIAHFGASPSQCADAVALLLESEPLVVSATLIDGVRAVGWVVSGRGVEPAVALIGEDFERRAELRPAPHPVLSGHGGVHIFDATAPGELLELRCLAGAAVAARIPNHFRKAATHATSPAADHVLAVVPVYKGLEETAACLNALQRQRASVPIRIVVVDDCSPEPELSAYLERQAAQGGFRLLRTPANAGFAGAVNAALAHRAGGDALLLNADVLLPSGAIERLRAAVYAAPRVGTATPFANNGEFTSSPTPFKPNPTPDAAAIEALDRRFMTQNAGRAIALPNGIGFCLYIRRDCCDAVGPLPTHYGRGYGEDVEFCLAARAAGFESVCAADVYVGHAGSVSFAQEKRALVVRNAAALETRYPGFRGECAAFVDADPLQPARARVELAAPPASVDALIVDPVGAPTLRQARIAELSRARPQGRTLALTRAAGRWRLRAADGGEPQSLSFDLAEPGERAALEAYLRAIAIGRIEWIGLQNRDEELAGLIEGLSAPVDILAHDAWPRRFAAAQGGDCAQPEGREPCAPCRNGRSEDDRRPAFLQSCRSLLSTDALADACARRALPNTPGGAALPAAGARPADGGARGRLAILAPEASPAVDRLVRRLARQVAANAEAEIVVIGQTCDDLAALGAGAHVTGAAALDEYPQLMRAYGAGAAFLPYRGSHFWVLAQADAEGARPRAYFDWSPDGVPARPGDLALDPSSCDVQVANRVLDWWLSGQRTGKVSP